MTWQSLGTFLISTEWGLTPLISTEVFRVSHLSVPVRNDYVKAVIALGFNDETGFINIFNPQRLTPRNEKEIFSFPKFEGLERRLAFKRLDKADGLIWLIEIETYQNMFYSSVNKQQATNAQPANDVSVTTSKTVIVAEKADGSRRSCLFSNTGPSTVYFKYVPVGTDPTAASVTVSANTYDFSLAPNEKFLDENSSQNAVVGICSGVVTTTAKVKVTEYIYS
ncbi:hypothetical protein LC593_31245 [Nostoc sp. CHAB 5844]|nr:hypothetical protein [Nostoc sp. CHAB 5844]